MRDRNNSLEIYFAFLCRASYVFLSKVALLSNKSANFEIKAELQVNYNDQGL